jgi:predicted nucleotidyltransferase
MLKTLRKISKIEASRSTLMFEPHLDKQVTEEKLRFYLESSTHFRFPFFDPENPYRKNGLFIHLEETLMEAGEKFQKDYGDNFISINLRGSWLRGIPLEDDDIDLLFIIRDLPMEEQTHIQSYCRKVLRDKHHIYRVCEGKIEDGVRVDPITFLDMTKVPTILSLYMYGLRHFHADDQKKHRDSYQDSFFGSKMQEKLSKFVQSGILIPYVGWIYGKWKKEEVFDEIAPFLPIPSRKTGLYGEDEVEMTKEILRKTFVARNLIYPAIKLQHLVAPSEIHVPEFKEEALALYRSIEPLKGVYARAIINYLYASAIELKLFGRRDIMDRVEMFAGHYDKLVHYILTVKF